MRTTLRRKRDGDSDPAERLEEEEEEERGGGHV
jgi:hypothetical protein